MVSAGLVVTRACSTGEAPTTITAIDRSSSGPNSKCPERGRPSWAKASMTDLGDAAAVAERVAVLETRRVDQRVRTRGLRPCRSVTSIEFWNPTRSPRAEPRGLRPLRLDMSAEQAGRRSAQRHPTQRLLSPAHNCSSPEVRSSPAASMIFPIIDRSQAQWSK